MPWYDFRMQKSVTTISEFVEWVEEVGDSFTTTEGYEAPWFRGHGSQHYVLTPTLYRTDEGRSKFADDELRNEFMRKALPLVAERAPRDDWEWYFLMQHYRAPTRLLDWTDSALVALYFALTSYSPSAGAEIHPVVWALNPWVLNRFQNRTDGSPLGADWPLIKDYLPPVFEGDSLPRFPIAIDPNYAAQRMLVQHSHFTVHGSDTRSFEMMQKHLSLDDGLCGVDISFEVQELDRWRWHLTLLGITETTIFPDLEGLARELRLEYQIDRSRPKSD